MHEEVVAQLLRIRVSESHYTYMAILSLSTIVLRNTNSDLRLPNKTTKNGQICFSYRGTKFWNAPPLEIKQASALQIFEEKLK